MKKLFIALLALVPVLLKAEEPAVCSIKYNNGTRTEFAGTYDVYTVKNNQYRIDYFGEYSDIDDDDNLVMKHSHEVILSWGKGRTPMKYEDEQWQESYAAPQEVGNTWNSTLMDLSDIYVKYSGFQQSGTSTILGKTATCYKGVVRNLDTPSGIRMVGYSVLSYEKGNNAEIYVWNGITLRIVVEGEVIFQVLDYTENVPDEALTQTLNVSWMK